LLFRFASLPLALRIVEAESFQKRERLAVTNITSVFMASAGPLLRLAYCIYALPARISQSLPVSLSDLKGPACGVLV
jgi:hypothetical protein